MGGQPGWLGSGPCLAVYEEGQLPESRHAETHGGYNITAPYPSFAAARETSAQNEPGTPRTRWFLCTTNNGIICGAAVEQSALAAAAAAGGAAVGVVLRDISELVERYW